MVSANASITHRVRKHLLHGAGCRGTGCSCCVQFPSLRCQLIPHGTLISANPRATRSAAKVPCAPWRSQLLHRLRSLLRVPEFALPTDTHGTVVSAKFLKQKRVAAKHLLLHGVGCYRRGCAVRFQFPSLRCKLIHDRMVSANASTTHTSAESTLSMALAAAAPAALAVSSSRVCAAN